MGFLEDALANALVRRLAGVDAPQLPGPLNALPDPAKRVLGATPAAVPGLGTLAGPGGQLAQALANRLPQVDEAAGKALTGASFAGLGEALRRADTPLGRTLAPALPLIGPNIQGALALRAALGGAGIQPSDPLAGRRNLIGTDDLEEARRAFAGGSGNAYERARAANEAAARDDEFATGVTNVALSPSNLAGPLGKVTERARFNRLASALQAVDRAQSLPFEALGEGARPALRKALGSGVAQAAGERLARAFAHDPATSGRAAGGNGGVAADRLVQLADGVRGYGPSEAETFLPPPATWQMPNRPPELSAALFERKSPTPRTPEKLPETPNIDVSPEPAAEVAKGLDLTDRVGTIKQIANGPLPDVSGVLRDLHHAIYPGKQLDYAIPALLGQQKQGLRTSALLDNPDGNMAEPYLDYLLNRVQRDPQAAARLGEVNPDLAGDVAALAPSDLPLHEHKELVQALFEAGPFRPGATVARGGDIAAGGDDKLIAPRLGATLAGALTGGGVGAIGGALAPADDNDERLHNALLGFAGGAVAGGNVGAVVPEIAQAAGKAFAPDSTARLVGRHALDTAQAEQRAANAAVGEGRLFPGVRDTVNMWRSNTVTHPKNILQDEGSGRLFLGGAQGKGASDRLAPIREQMAQRLKAVTPWEREPALVQDPLAAIGKGGYAPQLGDSLAQAEKGLVQAPRSTTQEAAGSLALSLLNPAGFATNAIGAAASGALGSIRPALRGAFRGVNDFQQATFRRAAFADELDTTLGIAADTILPRLQAAGVDVSTLDPSGKFSPADIAALAGPKAGEDWRALTDKAVGMAETRAKFIFGDYSKKSGFEQVLGKAVPFASWAIRAYPVAVEMAARHPGVALAVYHILDASSESAGKDGRPGYTAGMIPVSTDAPFVGALARAYLGGQDGTAYVDPIGAFSPVGGDMMAPEQAGEQNWYQRANALLGRAGLPQANPAIQAGAYVLGLDYKSPGALSRTQGLENAAALIPGNPQVPDIGGNTLRTARGIVSPLAEQIGIPGAEGDKNATQFDPITRRYGELVQKETGFALADPRNRAYLVGMTDPGNPLAQQARREVLLGGGVRNVGSLTNPIGAVTQGDDARTAKAAKDATPFTYDRMAAMQTSSPLLASLMQQQNDRYLAANPAASTYKVGNREQAQALLIQDWEKRHKTLQRGPDEYKKRRAEYIATLR